MADPNYLRSPLDLLADEQNKEAEALLAGQQRARAAAPMPDVSTAKPVAQAAPAPANDEPVAPRRMRSANLLPPDEYRPLFDAAADKHGVPVNVIMALAQQESGYNPKAIGTPTEWGTAKGMLQYLDSTAKGHGINAFDPAQAIDAAAKEIRSRMDKGMSFDEIVMEHFAGPDRKLWGPKTAAYGKEVIAKAYKIGDLLMNSAQASEAPAPAAKVEASTADSDIPAGWIPISAKEAEDYEATLGAAAKTPSTGRSTTEEWITDPLKRGFKSAKQGLQSSGAQFDARVLETIGKIDNGEKVQDKDDALGYQYMNAEQRAAVKKEVATAFKGAVQSVTETGKEIAAIPQDPIIAKAQQAKTFDEFWSYFKQKPIKFIANVGVESAPAMVPGLALGGGAGLAARAVGAGSALTAAAAGMGAGSYAMDFNSSVLEGLRENGIDVNDADALTKAFSDPKMMKKVRDSAHAHATVVGAADALSGGLAGKTLVAGKGVARKAANLGAQTVAQGTMGAAGEAGGQLAQGKELEAGAIASEFVGELAGAPVEVAGAAALKAKDAVQGQPIEQPAPVAAPVPPSQVPPVPAGVVPPAPTTSGPLTAAVEKTVEEAPRVVVAAPDGQVAPGTLEGYQEDDQGGFTAQIKGDDGQVYTITDQDGLQITPVEPAPAGPLMSSVEAVAEEHAVAPAAPNEQALAEIEAAKPPPPPAPPATPEEMYGEMDLPALRERLKYIANQAKASGGMNKMFMDHRKAVEKAIKVKTDEAQKASKLAEEPLSSGPFDDMAAANKMALRVAEKSGVPQEVVESKGKFKIKPIEEADERGRSDRDAGGDGQIVTGGPVPAGVDGGERVSGEPGAVAAVGQQPAIAVPDATKLAEPKPALTDEHIGKTFKTDVDAKVYIAKNKIGKTHRIVVNSAEKYEVRPVVRKAAKAAVAEKPVVAAPSKADKAAERQAMIDAQVATANDNAAARAAEKAAPVVEPEKIAQDETKVPDVALKAAQSKKKVAQKAPWEMSGKEWAAERESVRPDNTESNFTKASGSQAVAAHERLQDLLYGVTDAARQKLNDATAKKTTLSPDEVDDLMDRINTPVSHRDVVEKALAEGKPVPDEILAEYPDLTSEQQAASVEPGATAGDARPAPAAKQKKLTGKAAVAERARQLADYFTPGNVVKAYGGHDRIVAYEPNDDGGFSVTVQGVVKEDGKWVPAEGAAGRERTHATKPDERTLRAGPVERAPAKAEKAAAAPEPVEQTKTETEQEAAAEPAEERDDGADIPKAFYKKVKVPVDVWIQDEGKYETVELPASEALASVREDIVNLRSLLDCMRG